VCAQAQVFEIGQINSFEIYRSAEIARGRLVRGQVRASDYAAAAAFEGRLKFFGWYRLRALAR
jgi:hypothetical protein